MFTELYYWMYKAIKRNKSNKDPEQNAIFLFSSFEGLNLFTIWGILNHFLNIFIPKNTIIIVAIFLGISILLLNYIFLYRKRTEISVKIEMYTRQRKNVGKLLFILYVLGTLFLVYYVMINLVPVRY